ncbi:winged helix-turn-helix domain-containing protein [Paenibacillus nanensis]|nr:winged helix-turn-helix domain-containing protein [Paenibacillus nanensis]
MIQFDSDTGKVAYAGESVQLLPKEFALFQFLYEHAGRSFTRERLLDAVWPLEEPTDRTVDDHIYRIRKKVARWSHLLRIETVRGQGYKLIRLTPKLQARPLLHDEQFAADVNRMMNKYHGLGMGAAMQLLAEHRDILSLPVDPYYDAYLHFVRGDLDWLLTTDSLDLWKKLTYAVFVYEAAQPGDQTVRRYYEGLIARGHLLEWSWLCDLRLGAIHHDIGAGRLEEAQRGLEAIREEIAELQSPSFTSVFLIAEMMLRMEQNRLGEAEAKLRECEALLAQHPIQRERGAFLVAKGMLLYRQGAHTAARHTVEEGVETTRETHFIPHLLVNLRRALLFLHSHSCDEAYAQRLQRQWEQLALQFRLDELQVKAGRLLERHL